MHQPASFDIRADQPLLPDYERHIRAILEQHPNTTEMSTKKAFDWCWEVRKRSLELENNLSKFVIAGVTSAIPMYYVANKTAGNSVNEIKKLNANYLAIFEMMDTKHNKDIEAMNTKHNEDITALKKQNEDLAAMVQANTEYMRRMLAQHDQSRVTPTNSWFKLWK